ncbi:uncharacterized protein TRIADDRAFT_53553 [Trichoplax adhaerens]|uniref:O-fucosyltransferase family protein n=1 Tax=Trichoplax adhaerens TaxID=10228 RepID=B3RPI3_TRIAD|nr:predicted protein [Trichoplax adhaerens]EDV28192.1 predicted protein [Trichoplax adhaerens]|eukprot:XP_002110026.1 predicted protein [Trichoplax adhaerens]
MATRMKKVATLLLFIATIATALWVVFIYLNSSIFVDIEPTGLECDNDNVNKMLSCQLQHVIQSTTPKQQQQQHHIAPHSQDCVRLIFSYRYFEQLAMATTNFISLASLATLLDGSAVIPYVHHSRMSGVPQGIGRNRKLHDIRYFNMSLYFDLKGVNQVLQQHRYSPLVSYDYLTSRCNKTLDVLIHFIFQGNTKDAKKWYKINNRIFQQVKDRLAKTKKGWTFCPFIANANIAQQLGDFNIKRYICVDPTKFQSVEKFKRQVLKDTKCIGFVQWKGIGTNRALFNLTRNQRIKPSLFPHNKKLISIAKTYIKRYLSPRYIAVHGRIERLLIGKTSQAGIRYLRSCMQVLNRNLFYLRQQHNIDRSFLSTDLADSGSDTIYNKYYEQERKLEKKKELYHMAIAELSQPHVFNASLVDKNDHAILRDNGATAIVEMQILSHADILITIGGGNFQQWIVDLYMKKHPHNPKIIPICQNL